jgi:hypothetical protein
MGTALFAFKKLKIPTMARVLFARLFFFLFGQFGNVFLKGSGLNARRLYAFKSLAGIFLSIGAA